MRRDGPRRGRGSVLVGMLLVAACGASGPSAIEPSSTSARPSSSMATAAPSGIPTTGSTSPSASPATGLPVGWTYALACDDEDTDCRIRLLDAAGADAPGWPVDIDGSCTGDALDVGADGTVVVACQTADRPAATLVHAIRPSGERVGGWPVRLVGAPAPGTWNDFEFGSSAHGVHVGPDGTVFVATSRRESDFRIFALTSTGERRSGWPVGLPEGAQGFDVAEDGTVVGWWLEGFDPGITLGAKRSRFTMLGSDGTPLAGWPIGSKGAASGPFLIGSGIIYVSATGKVWGHDRAGAIVSGWPYQLPYPSVPEVDAQGRLRFLLDSMDDGPAWIVVLDGPGHVAPGWPYRAVRLLATPMCDTPSFPWYLHATDDDGTLYVGVDQGAGPRIVALDRTGTVRPGWPVEPPVGWTVMDLQPADGGGVTVSLVDSSNQACSDQRSIRREATYASDGTDVTVTPDFGSDQVTTALRPTDLRATDGSTTVAMDDPIELRYDLVNATDQAVEVREIDYYGYALRLAGTEITWLERLDRDDPIDCGADASANGQRARLATQVVDLGRARVPSGGRVVHDLEVDALDGCLDPGDFRITVDLATMDGTVVGSTSIDLHVDPGDSD